MGVRVPSSGSVVREGFWRGASKLNLEDSETTSQGKRKGEAFQTKDVTEKNEMCSRTWKEAEAGWYQWGNSLPIQGFVGDDNDFGF